MPAEPKHTQWIITEHRQILLESPRGIARDDAFGAALRGEPVSFIVSDHTQRYIYPVGSSVAQDTQEDSAAAS